jgi:hypothetical protein
MLVGMELVAARRVSAQVSVQLVGTRHHRQLLVHRHRTASRAMQVDTARLRVPHVRALVTALWAHSRLARLLPVLHHQTALRARLVDMELEAVQRVSAPVTALLAGIRHHRLQLDHRRQTASRAMLVGMALVAARRASARVSVRLVGIPSHRVLQGRHHHTASPVQSAHTSAHRAAVHPPTAQTVCSGLQTLTAIPPHRARCAHRVSTLVLLPLSVQRVSRVRRTWTVTQPHRVLRVRVARLHRKALRHVTNVPADRRTLIPPQALRVQRAAAAPTRRLGRCPVIRVTRGQQISMWMHPHHARSAMRDITHPLRQSYARTAHLDIRTLTETQRHHATEQRTLAPRARTPSKGLRHASTVRQVKQTWTLIRPLTVRSVLSVT